MVRNVINPDGLINRPDKLINRPDDLLICSVGLINRPDKLINRPDVFFYFVYESFNSVPEKI